MKIRALNKTMTDMLIEAPPVGDHIPEETHTSDLSGKQAGTALQQTAINHYSRRNHCDKST